MENLTIKQLLDLGADINIYFHNCESKEDAETKVKSLGFDGELETWHSKPNKAMHGFSAYSSVERFPIGISAYYDRKEKLK